MKRLRLSILIGACAAVIAYTAGASGPLLVTAGAAVAAVTYALTGI